MVSVIVPVYNVSKYIEATLDSILNSTYRDIELVLVDDGSTDGSGGICDQYASCDDRIHVIHQKNAGVSAARNAGLDLAKGEYIGFVDGDDVIHPNMFQVLYDSITSGDYDISMVLGQIVNGVDFKSFFGDRTLGLSANQRILSRQDMFKGLMGPNDNDYQYAVVWNKLYKRSLLEELRFNITHSEDMEWNARVFLKMNKAILVDAKLYCWIHHAESITHQSMNSKKIDRINSFLLALDKIPVSMKVERSMCLEKIYKVILHTRHHAHDTDYNDEAISLCRFSYKTTIQEYLQSEIPLLKKYSLLLFYHAPWLYGFFMWGTEMAAKLRG